MINLNICLKELNINYITVLILCVTTILTVPIHDYDYSPYPDYAHHRVWGIATPDIGTPTAVTGIKGHTDVKPTVIVPTVPILMKKY